MEVDDPRPASSSARPVLSVDGRSAAGSIGRHYVVPDTNVVLHQMDLLEAEAFGADIVMLQTVLEEVRNRSLPLYNRLNALVAESGRRVWSFANEACLCVDRPPSSSDAAATRTLSAPRASRPTTAMTGRSASRRRGTNDICRRSTWSCSQTMPATASSRRPTV